MPYISIKKAERLIAEYMAIAQPDKMATTPHPKMPKAGLYWEERRGLKPYPDVTRTAYYWMSIGIMQLLENERIEGSEQIDTVGNDKQLGEWLKEKGWPGLSRLLKTINHSTLEKRSAATRGVAIDTSGICVSGRYGSGQTNKTRPSIN